MDIFLKLKCTDKTKIFTTLFKNSRTLEAENSTMSYSTKNKKPTVKKEKYSSKKKPTGKKEKYSPKNN